MLSIDEIKRRISPICQKYSVSEAFLFGSYARGDATEDSDVDIRVVVQKPFGLLALNRLNDDFEAALQKQVDVVTYIPKKDTLLFCQNFASNLSREEVRVYG